MSQYVYKKIAPESVAHLIGIFQANVKKSIFALFLAVKFKMDITRLVFGQMEPSFGI